MINLKLKQYIIHSIYIKIMYYYIRFLRDMIQIPDMTRNIALVGNIHSGKTSIVDCLVMRTHPELLNFSSDSSLSFTDNLFIENQVKFLCIFIKI